jgi:peptidoglycan hydrolase-like protein with peptidoglycan-binding domain
MNFQAITKLVLLLLANRDAFISIVTDGIALWKKIQTVMPGVTEQLSALAKPAAASPTSTYSIEWLQESLNKLVGTNLSIDGKYGTSTQEAVKQFQTAHGLTPDGWAGVQTQAAIVDALK